MLKLTTKLTNINELKKQVDQYVIGHEEEKMQIISLILNHFNKYDLYKKGLISQFNKSNAIVYGPSGNGKTFIIETVCRLLNIPFMSIDSTNITAKGWKGEDIEDYLKVHYKQCDDESSFSRSVVFFDEFDKLTNFYEGPVDYGKKDQSAFLKVLESDEVVLEIGSSYRTIDISGMLFIFAGAFTGLNKNESNVKIGFSEQDSKKKSKKKEIDSQQLIEYGIMPELCGRIGQTIEIKPLTYDEMKQVLYSKGSALREWQEYYNCFNAIVRVDDEVIDDVVKKALSSHTGVRELNNIINAIFNKNCLYLVNNDFNGIYRIMFDDKGELTIVLEEKLERKYDKDIYFMLNQRIGFTGQSNNDMKTMSQLISGIIKRIVFKENLVLKDEKKAINSLLRSFCLYLIHFTDDDCKNYYSLFCLVEKNSTQKDIFRYLMAGVEEKNPSAYRQIMKHYHYFELYCSKYPFSFDAVKRGIIEYLELESLKKKKESRSEDL